MVLVGKSVSRGVAIGEVMRYAPFCPKLSTEKIPDGLTAEAVAAYETARQSAKNELSGLEERLLPHAPAQAKIMAAHRDILLDPAMDEEIRTLIEREHLSPDAAAAQVYDCYAELLAASKNELMKERSADLLDVKLRLLRCLAGAPEYNLSALQRPVIIVADDLFPSDTAGIDRDNVLGIITQTGGSTSHTAIIAKSYEIPAVLGVPDALRLLSDGETIILDAEEGRILSSPSDGELLEYEQKAELVSASLREERMYLNSVPVTQDGERIEIRLNVAAATDQELSKAAYADGCGLFRTEFLYLDREHLPTEDEQYVVYSKVLKAFGEKPVILRTMDIGGDKQVPGLELPREQNPFLGIRGLRLSIELEQLFRTQVRAVLRASVHGNLKVMFPMVGALDELRRAREIFLEEEAALDTQGIPWDRHLKIGIMVEVPSIALIADLAAEEADFVSIGTNDLTQYLCAADRMNPAVGSYYQEYHPAVFRVLSCLASTFNRAGKDISICGELGGDALALPALIGMGIRQFSMGAASLGGAKRVVRHLKMADAAQLAENVLHQKTHGDICRLLREFGGRQLQQEKEC